MVTRVAVQSRGPLTITTEVTYLQLGSPAICVRVAVCLHMQTNCLLYLLPTPTQTNQPIAHLRGQHPMTASEPPAKWGADSRLMMVCCADAEWKRAPQPAGGEEETR